jgi:hypothetical protein
MTSEEMPDEGTGIKMQMAYRVISNGGTFATLVSELDGRRYRFIRSPECSEAEFKMRLVAGNVYDLGEPRAYYCMELMESES